ncbi:MAG TPA: ferritin family protein [Leptospiraceae bacterium]|nr:ferritin family protein [Leptospirales bacterium]HMU81946.1 ferritin family protein [Leptospiraceae bacterium]HMW61615.1 ferritin family protein [Leptospiraceae bacterium]HMX58049.1 ferritin family protein [Leptospiraceae bacterium]HMY46777.1 ferritin family protein [Leptospiraceae bacterium]
MARTPVKKTTFLEAVAACIQHEKEVFGFYLKQAEALPEGAIKKLFFQLAEDVEEHIRMISEIYSQVKGGEALPNLKMASEVQKFNGTSLQILMRRLDRITGSDGKGNEIEAIALATREHEDAAAFYRKMTDKFEDKGIQVLFGQLANFQDECRLLLESYGAYLTQGTPASQPSAYWDET